MPTKREREYYRMGFTDGQKFVRGGFEESDRGIDRFTSSFTTTELLKPQTKRKLSAWNKFVKANSKKPRFRYKSGANKGKLNLKKMGVAFRKTPAGKRKK